MSYTVMGDTVNLASRLEGANKLYGCRCLISEATAAACADAIELREIDRLVAVGQTQPQSVFEIMARKGEVTSQQTSAEHWTRKDLPRTASAAGTTRRELSRRRSMPCLATARQWR